MAMPAWAADNYASDPFDPVIARQSWDLIGRTEVENGVPPGLLHAMSLVETGRGISGWVMPWPYTVGVNSPGKQSYLKQQHALNGLTWYRKMGFNRYDVTAGSHRLNNARAAQAEALFKQQATADSFTLKPRPFGRRFGDAEQATAFVYKMFASGHKSLDLGLMQINWKVHGENFASVRDVFDPNTNVHYAVNYLLKHRKTRDWWGSVGRYHSGTSVYARKYIKNVWTWYRRVHDYNTRA